MAGLVNFEDEEEVRGYLENLHVEYSYQCFREKDPDGKRPRRHPGPPPRGRRAGASNPPSPVPRRLPAPRRLPGRREERLRGGGAGAPRQLRGPRPQRELLPAGGLPGHRQRWAGGGRSRCCLAAHPSVLRRRPCRPEELLRVRAAMPVGGGGACGRRRLPLSRRCRTPAFPPDLAGAAACPAPFVVR